jgi:hypothetical protein
MRGLNARSTELWRLKLSGAQNLAGKRLYHSCLDTFDNRGIGSIIRRLLSTMEAAPDGVVIHFF